LDSAAGYAGWVFELNAKKWSAVPRSPIAPPRGAIDPITAKFVGDEVIVWGADDGKTQGAVLDTRTLEWRALPNAPIAPRYRRAAGVVGSRLLVWGGYGPAPGLKTGPLDDGAVYDASTNRWSAMPAIPVEGLRSHCAGAVANHRFVVIGRRLGEPSRPKGAVFDPETGQWDVLPDPPFEVGVDAACAATADRLVVWSGKSGGHGLLATGACYDFWTRKWQKLPESPIAPRMLAFSRLDGTRLTVWGGWLEMGHPATFLRDGAAYDFERKSWEKLPHLPGETPYAMHPGW
jgi:hypothetical protein